MSKKLLCICEDGGLGERYFVNSLQKQTTDLEVCVATETKSPPIQDYDYVIVFECADAKLSRFLTLMAMLGKKTKKIFFSQDPHINKHKHLFIVQKYGFDAIITTQKNEAKEFNKGKPTLYCTWAHEPVINRTLNLRRHYDLGIAGTLNPFLHPVRCSYLKQLNKKFDLFPFAEVKEGEASVVYSASKIGFNYAIGEDVNFRVFEVIASGALLITDDKPLKNGLGDIFEPGKDIVTYKNQNYKDLEKKVEYYLNNKKEREAIIKNAYEKIKTHTYENRAKEIVKFLKELK